MNRGDTAYLMLNYTINGEPLVDGAYQEIELQINKQGTDSIKKLLSTGEIKWGMIEYEEEDKTKTFTGYYCTLSQNETFSLRDGSSYVQLRVLVNDEVGSSDISYFDIGQTLSKKVLE